MTAAVQKQRRPRLTLARLKVLAEFLKHPRRALAECQVSALSGIKTGSVHPTLRKLEALGWLESEWETPEKKQPSYPARRFYRLTKAGRAGARAAQEARWGRHDGRPLKVGIDG